MNENERVIMEATLEELEIAENELLYDVSDKIGDRSHDILLAAIRCFIEARKMYGEED